MAGGSQSPQDLAAGMIPGVPFVNWLSGLQNPMNSRPDPRVQAEQAQAMRRARMGYAINQRRSAANLPPLADHHLDAAIDAELHSYALQANQNRNALRLNTSPSP